MRNFLPHMLVLIINQKKKNIFTNLKIWNEKGWSHWPLPIIFCVRIIAFEALWDFPSMSEADLLRFRTELHRGQSTLNKVMLIQFCWLYSFLFHKLSNFLKLQLCAKLLMGDDIGSGLSSMGRSWDALIGGENVNRRPKNYRFLWHHPLITQLTISHIFILYFLDSTTIRG